MSRDSQTLGPGLQHSVYWSCQLSAQYSMHITMVIFHRSYPSALGLPLNPEIEPVSELTPNLNQEYVPVLVTVIEKVQEPVSP